MHGHDNNVHVRYVRMRPPTPNSNYSSSGNSYVTVQDNQRHHTHCSIHKIKQCIKQYKTQCLLHAAYQFNLNNCTCTLFYFLLLKKIAVPLFDRHSPFRSLEPGSVHLHWLHLSASNVQIRIMMKMSAFLSV